MVDNLDFMNMLFHHVGPKVYDGDIERNYFLLKEVIIGIGFNLSKGNPTLADYQVS